MRCFVGIPIPKKVKKSINDYTRKLKEDQPGIKWVQEDNLHITLRFLGEIDEQKLERVKGLIKNRCKDHGPFEIQLSGTGYFPSERRARVIWIGVAKGEGDLKRIFNDLESGFVELGFKKERPFHAHLTLGRVKKPRPFSLPQYKKESFTVSKVVLFKSTLTPKGAIYEPLLINSLAD